ncbi:MAG: bifunctional riboflavin kinase/FAD synthetase [Campylobacterales bacterium]
MSAILQNKTITALAIGRFDGMHLGHQALFNKLGTNGGILIIDNGLANLTPRPAAEELVPYPIFYYQLEEIRDLDASEFVALLLRDFPMLCTIVVGYDFRFGHDRQGDATTLRQLFKGDVIVVDPVSVEDEVVHARLIRYYLLQGDVAHAAKLLGRAYRICGKVVKGQGIGRHHLYATLNIETEHYLLPAEGVYATHTQVEGVWHDSVTFLGHRVSTDGNFAIESHILDDTIQAADKCCIDFIGRIRPNGYFESFAQLKERIAQDLIEAKEILSSTSLTT